MFKDVHWSISCGEIGGKSAATVALTIAVRDKVCMGMEAFRRWWDAVSSVIFCWSLLPAAWSCGGGAMVF